MALATRTNGIRPDFTSSRFTINGERYYSLKSLNYSFESKHKALYGQPRTPVGYTAGQVVFSGSMELLREEFLKLMHDLSEAGNGADPTTVAFGITHSFSFGDQPIQTDQLNMVLINKGDFAHAAGDEGDYIKVDLYIGELILDGLKIGGEV